MCGAEEKHIYAVGGCNYGRHIQEEQSRPDASMKAALIPPWCQDRHEVEFCRTSKYIYQSVNMTGFLSVTPRVSTYRL